MAETTAMRVLTRPRVERKRMIKYAWMVVVDSESGDRICDEFFVL